MVAKHHPEAIAEGYWFVTPYTRVGVPPTTEQKDFMPCMNGAHIYDGDGNLVWSGACVYDNRNVFNFRPVNINGTDLLTFFLPGEEHGFNLPLSERLPSGVLMDNRYQEVSRTNAKGYLLDGHEFNIMPDGKSTLLTTLKAVDADAKLIGQQSRRVLNTGFQEAEMETGKLLFDWDPISHGVLLNESCDTTGMVDPKIKDPPTWDFFHINSVDKFLNGDYLTSSRHMSTLYKVSKDDGHIIWRLGGCYDNSDFVMEENLPFFWQHHARIRHENATHTIISVFDNASEDRDRGEPIGHNPPVGKIIILDHAAQPPTAKMLRRFDRPDGGQTAALGSVSVLGNDVATANVFIDWAFEGYISEYDNKDGVDRLVMEARFVSDRKRSYRAYKFPFKANPTEDPRLVVLPLGFGQDEVASAFYVSWNGATEVASWVFYGGEQRSAVSMKSLATVKKRGFETEWVMPGVVQYAYAEALDAYGQSLGKTSITTITPSINEQYQIPYPAMQGANLGAPTPQLPAIPDAPTAAEDSVAYNDGDTGPSPPLNNLPPPPAPPPPPPPQIPNANTASQQGQNFADKEANNAAYLVVDAFACFGLYFVVRSLIQRFGRRRKGYSALPAYSES